MQTAIINIKADPKLKKEAQRVAASIGLPLGTVINNYLRQFVVDKRVEFKHPLMPNKATAKRLLEAEVNIAAGKNLSPVFKTPEELFKHLNSL